MQSDDDFLKLEESADEDKRDNALAQLEAALSHANDRRLEERFIWIMVTVMLVDIILLADSQNVTLPLVVLVLQLIILVLLARRMGIEDVALLVDRVLHGFSRRPPGAE